MNDKSTTETQGEKPIGFVLRSTSQTNFPWLNTKHNSVGAGNPRMCGNMRKYLGDAQVWKSERNARSYVDTNPRSGISNLEVVPIYSDPRVTAEAALKPATEVTIISIWSRIDGFEGKAMGRDKNVVYAVKVVTTNSVKHMLGQAFSITNADNRPLGNKVCSTSSGDIMVLGGKHYLVEPVDFREITFEESEKIQKLTSRDTNFGYGYLVKNNLI